jgi:hypothetical protein
LAKINPKSFNEKTMTINSGTTEIHL